MPTPLKFKREIQAILERGIFVHDAPKLCIWEKLEMLQNTLNPDKISS